MTQADDQPVLIAYDGSRHAQAAVRQAAELFPGRRAIIATVWRSAQGSAGAARAALPQSLIDQGVRNLDAAAADDARQTAEEGAQLAREAGMDVRAEAVRTEASIWGAIVHAVDRHTAVAVVVGSRGRSALRSAVLGGVSNGVVHHCRRPVVVVHLDDDDASDRSRHA